MSAAWPERSGGSALPTARRREETSWVSSLRFRTYFFLLRPAVAFALAGSFSTQWRVRLTAFFQPARPSSRCLRVHCGSKTLSPCQFLRSSSSVLQNPVASPAP